MGLCLSCLGGNDDGDGHERTSLLGHGAVSDEDLQEELLKQRRRQTELAGIVNNLSDSLIDLLTFLVAGADQAPEAADEEPLAGPAGQDNPTKPYPHVWLAATKNAVASQAAQEATFELRVLKEPLYVVF